eukprot:COSAG01_NODE_2629_length_7348_cov_14.364414_6_plen_134_part_00
MRLDQKTIDQVLAAVQRGKMPATIVSAVSTVLLPKPLQASTPRTASAGGTTRAVLTLAGSSSSSASDDVKEYLKKRGLEAWHGHLSKHLGVQTVSSVRAITAIDLRRMATSANMRLDQKTIDQVLQAIRRRIV